MLWQMNLLSGLLMKERLTKELFLLESTSHLWVQPKYVLQCSESYKFVIVVLGPGEGQQAIAENNWDGAAVAKFNKWKKRVTHYIKVEVEDDVIFETPVETNRDLYYYPDEDLEGFDLSEQAICYEICEFDGDMPIVEGISDAEAEAIEEFLSVFVSDSD